MEGSFRRWWHSTQLFIASHNVVSISLRYVSVVTEAAVVNNYFLTFLELALFPVELLF